MDIVMFALIGSMLNAKAVYWICFGIYSAIKVTSVVIDLTKK